jgi:hypothetical protein
MWAIGGDEVQFDAPRPGQPGLHQFGMVVAGVVDKQME